MYFRDKFFHLFLFVAWFTIASADFLNFDGLRSYAKYLDWESIGYNTTGNVLWNGIIRDCSRETTFSCIQKNAFSYLNDAFVERDNITIFDGFVMRRNDIDYDKMRMKITEKNSVDDNLVNDIESDDEESLRRNEETRSTTSRNEEDDDEDDEAAEHRDEYTSPLEEITHALHDKTIKFLATRNYEVQLPEFFFSGSTVKISPRQIDDNGALVRIDFGQRAIDDQGRLFKKLKKFIQNKLLVSFLALILIIKLIKVKFLFVIPFLFGVGTAKKLFLKLLLFLVPAFGQVFKLCSSYYSSKAHKYYHHHHQIAHHHHHVPVPVPTYYEPNHHSHHNDDHETYDYPPPYVQVHREMEELREWGIEPTEEIVYDDPNSQQYFHHPPPLSPVYPGNSVGYPPSNSGPRPPPGPVAHQENFPPTVGSHGQHLAFNGWIDEHNRFNRRIGSKQPSTPIKPPPSRSHQVAQVSSGSSNLPSSNSINLATPNVVNGYAKTQHNGFVQQNVNVPNQVNVQQGLRPVQQLQTRRVIVQKPVQSAANVASLATQSGDSVVGYDDAYYGPIVQRLKDIFNQLGLNDETCRERLVCSMYKNPELYAPHSNLVSNELSRDPEEFKHGDVRSNSGNKFHQYLNAARLGQNGDDCQRRYSCQMNAE